MNDRLGHLLATRLEQRAENGQLRRLRALPTNAIDFASNDYLGLATDGSLSNLVKEKLINNDNKQCGATGSRLISGDTESIQNFENQLAEFYETEEALIFPSGYDANIGLLSSLGREEEVTFYYDEEVHASMRDGFRLARCKAHKFRHNDFDHLHQLLERSSGVPIICVESLYSMAGDSPDLHKLINVSEEYNASIIIDEAHSSGIYGNQGQGLVSSLGLSDKFVARIHTWGKAHGCHGATVATNTLLKDYLVNYARSFIYTTGLSSPALTTGECSYELIARAVSQREKLHELVRYFTTHTSRSSEFATDHPHSPIQSLFFPSIEQLSHCVESLKKADLFAVPIFSPTVAAGSERIRISLHSFNTTSEIDKLFEIHQKSL